MVAEHNLHLVSAAVVDQWDRCGIHRRAVQGRSRDASAPTDRVRYDDLVAALEEAPGHPVLGPRRRNARIDDERGAAPPETENALEAGAIHPAGRSGVPT